MRSRWLWTVVVVVVCIAVVAAVVGCARKPAGPPTPTAEPYRIGAMFDYTGNAAPLGEPERKTAQLLQEQINAAGGINGHPLEILIEDSKSEEQQAVLVANKFIDEGVLAIVGPSTSGTTLAIIDTVQKAQVPLLSCAASIKITQPWQDRKWVFKTPQSDADALRRLIDYMKPRNLKRIGFIYDSNPFGTSGLEQAEKLLPQAGIQIVVKEPFGTDETVMTTHVTNLLKAKPDAVICWGTNPGPARIADAMYKMKVKLPLLMSHGVANRKFIELAGEGANGVVLPAGRLIVADQIPDTDLQKKALLEYAKAYEGKFKEPANTFGGHARDAIELAVKGLRAVGPDRAKLRDALEGTKGFVGIGGIFNYSPEDHNGLTKDAFVLVQIEDGQWKMIQETPQK